ncbi:hypothetical protein ASPCAL08139 [Aspergillus calidoustus]|uniref:SWIM-type domain-containing protein n=1 Tax=Aspergillus calidoustus TaxID=454130 RepID=A0A0U5CQ10_ASPCI|nr:hypothetical protein ASPCAL08139 [Aspergillus calidoustus]
MGTVIEPDTFIYNGDHRTDLPRTSQFINDLLSKLSQYTTIDTGQSSDEEAPEDGPPCHHHYHQSHRRPTSTFPHSQLTDIKPLMLTLHCIFPNELLLALDILDRGLIRRVLTEDTAMPANRELETSETEPGKRSESDDSSMRKENFFFVTSASTTSNHQLLSNTQPKPHQQNHWQTKGYEVRLHAWNCTCPAFTLSAFRNLGPEPSSPLSPSPEKMRSGVNERVEDTSPSSTPDHAGEVCAQADADAGDTGAYSFGGTFPMHPESAPAVCKHILACLLVAMCPGLGGKSGGGGRFVAPRMEEVAALCAGWGG